MPPKPMFRALFPLLFTATAALAQEATPPQPRRFEGAVGLLTLYAPAFGGTQDYRWRLSPAGFIRYGRFTVSGAGGFTTRRDDDVERGLAAALVDRDALKLSLAARWTNGRKESNSDRLAGLGDIEGTLLARLRLQWKADPDHPWTWSAALNTDLLGHGNGWFLDLGVARTWRLGPGTRLHFGSTLTYGSDTHMQSFYGITPEQSVRSGYPVFTPGHALRDLSASLQLRHEFGPHWGGYVGAATSLHLGGVRRSPLVTEPFGASVGGGLVYRF